MFVEFVEKKLERLWDAVLEGRLTEEEYNKLANEAYGLV